MKGRAAERWYIHIDYPDKPVRAWRSMGDEYPPLWATEAPSARNCPQLKPNGPTHPFTLPLVGGLIHGKWLVERVDCVGQVIISDEDFAERFLPVDGSYGANILASGVGIVGLGKLEG